MSTTAIKRIKGYCTKVNQSQWEELVKVADEVGVPVFPDSRSYGMLKPDRYVRLNLINDELCIYADHIGDSKLIPFPDFLAKLRGVEEWTPKAGEMYVFKDYYDTDWTRAEFVVCSKGKFVAWKNELDVWAYDKCEPIMHKLTITRAEAEKQLGKRIID